jgi:hypothetical protein
LADSPGIPSCRVTLAPPRPAADAITGGKLTLLGVELGVELRVTTAPRRAQLRRLPLGQDLFHLVRSSIRRSAAARAAASNTTGGANEAFHKRLQLFSAAQPPIAPLTPAALANLYRVFAVPVITEKDGANATPTPQRA